MRALGRIRTCGLLLRRQTLYPLSYEGGIGLGRGLEGGPIGLGQPIVSGGPARKIRGGGGGVGVAGGGGGGPPGRGGGAARRRGR